MVSRPDGGVRLNDRAKPAAAENEKSRLLAKYHKQFRGLRIAIVHDWLNGMRGGERVLEILCQAFPQAHLFTLFYEPQRLSKLLRRMPVEVSSLQRIPGSRRYYRLALPLFPRAVEKFHLGAFDLVISTSHCVAKGAAPPKKVPHLCYCFSPARYLWDQFDIYFNRPQTPAPIRWGMRLVGERLRRWDVETSHRVHRFAAISNHVARRIAQHYDRHAEVIYPPVRSDFFCPVPGAQQVGDYFLIVSALVPYKRVETAVEAFRRLDWPLLVAGQGPELRHLKKFAGPRTEFLGWVSNQRLRELYRHCRALIFPGEEDFGLVPLEAQACGRSVVALGRGGALETIVEGKTGVFFGESSADSLIATLARFRPEDFNSADCRAQALRFSQEKFLDEFFNFAVSSLEMKLPAR
ncbi:MAG: glycosyltransferase [bacterium]